jgi:hypothetical protein
MAPIILNKKGYQLNDNLTYNWELFNSRGIKNHPKLIEWL